MQHFVAAAVAYGWTEEEALVAIANIADNLVLANAEKMVSTICSVRFG
ncbi:hypothetical protein PYH37_004497 [Sinorhizobium numidicum]|uniref:Uncharacterized protein n=1 Tax=Sinorhizobium numidicum TaxID=680248 RepID=A0ABY8CW51_9HYPH|nr:hypothetical protein [Sinorhizobium numidicum]WEX76207.1 hypothetical protein PYH37_004497 [Sinorhizobium numidicum]WEX82866.1 hypothetical protein PYH38_005209 [Sinorhizobium numidicum]